MKLFPPFIFQNRWNVGGFVLGFITLPLLWWILSSLDSEEAMMQRFYKGEAESVLGGIYWTCKMHWDDHDPKDDCTREIITSDDYPFEPADMVEFELKGNATTFRATARHTGDPLRIVYSIDADGNIHDGVPGPG
ncbi:hypothetical protein NITGR_170003 [Nitrospina gracilis 3/211]|uniref:Uncharacterized protein n=1 Tax=Nitrospina gracilis (strain 3/211) TaxID=1266370 RepID=M1YWT0_NITG3|nr:MULTISPECIES: hypothetical protein [Nitrospina]MCF8722792.1 hypothetical protein [Nitrospina sp. Nb-3]CCQ89746.1 hypothetical protein NITGR_170003 [Nitrospina gracilis 3/211]